MQVIPLEFDFYKVNNWFVQGVNIHQDRLLTLVTRPVPDLLKACIQLRWSVLVADHEAIC